MVLFTTTLARFLLAYFLVRLALARLRARRSGKGGPNLSSLKLTELFRRAPAVETAMARPAAVAPRDSLCTGCTYAHIVWGHEPGEVLTFCEYAYPQREVPFPVRECTDYRPKRERCSAEIAIEGAVSLLPLEDVAEDIYTATAMRDGEGEI